MQPASEIGFTRLSVHHGQEAAVGARDTVAAAVDPLAQLDMLDRAILAALQVDGRRAFRVIARDLDVSEGTVRTRVRRLEESGVLRILAFVDPLRLGDALIAIINIHVASGQHEAVAGELSGWDEVSYVSSVLGSYDMSVQVMTSAVAELWELAQRIEALEGVTGTDSLIEMKVHKFKYLAPGLG
jgi:Lrp/AsnC family transcriptional regulator for asnA, asnC and gidA